uniref:Uncharacterized protein n=1 Tax=Glossina austeni TaxID=7395 RepID=A0A1A9UFF1_GLOAU
MEEEEVAAVLLAPEMVLLPTLVEIQSLISGKKRDYIEIVVVVVVPVATVAATL